MYNSLIEYIVFRKCRLNIIVLTCVIMGTTTIKAQSTDTLSLNIEWEEGRKLTWNDYRLRVFESNKGQLAVTSVRHSIKGELKGDLPDFEVKVRFIVSDSWTTDKSDMQLLGHEQLHFDIGELFRRRIKERIEKLRKQGEKQRAIYRYVIKDELYEFRLYSKKYDQETKHGGLREEQEKWEMQVWEELKRLQ